MWRKRLFWQLSISHLAVALLALIAVTWYATRSAGTFYRAQTRKELESFARVLEGEVRELLAAGDPAALDAFAKDRGKRSKSRITIIKPDGTVVGDTEQDPPAMENHAERPEVKEALAGAIGEHVHYSNTLRRDMLYVAVPVTSEGRVVAVLRTAIDVAALSEELGAIYGRIAWAGALVAAIAAALSVLMARRIARPLERLKEGAKRFARGDLAVRLSFSDWEELDSVAQSLNEMARQLDRQIKTILGQRNEVEAVLSSMVEGVIAVDTDERIISINQAACRMLDVKADLVQGKVIQEAVRNPALHDVVGAALSSEVAAERDIGIHTPEERSLKAHGTALRDGLGKRIGAVVVLHDVTRIRRLENVRRDFVANVSHELRTPITSIKGFVETLLEGALKVPSDAERFLAIIAKQADRLNAILEDLLVLANLEQGRDTGPLAVEECRLGEVLESAIQTCSHRAAEKGIEIDLACPPELRARVNAPLLEQAIVNLIDNAVKYSDPGTRVEVGGSAAAGGVTIAVRDRGCGIERQHLPRIFERFYRVDRARSRALGGTGLGLAIVKHIAQVHRGRVAVESSPGVGSTFTIHIPPAPPEAPEAAPGPEPSA